MPENYFNVRIYNTHVASSNLLIASMMNSLTHMSGTHLAGTACYDVPSNPPPKAFIIVSLKMSNLLGSS